MGQGTGKDAAGGKSLEGVPGGMSISVAAVVMGKSGAGKTTFYNKLCETDHLATYSSKSLTRQLYRSEVVQGGSRFIIIDTPGTDSKDEVFKHSFLLKEALTNEAVNAIFTLVQYNDRCDGALAEFDKTIGCLKEEYRDMVVVIISKFDCAPSSHVMQIKADYTEAFAEREYHRIMFHSKDVSAIEAAGEMWGLMKDMPRKQMRYDEKEFLEYFPVADDIKAQKMNLAEKEKKASTILGEYKKMIVKLGDEVDKDDLILSAVVSSRHELDQLHDQFVKQFGKQMVDLDCYTNSIRLQKIIENEHRAFRDSVKEFMSYNPDDVNDWRNSIRRCPHCGEVWVKVSGCDAGTTCGSREFEKDVIERPWVQYRFEEGTNGARRWRRNPAPLPEPVATGNEDSDEVSEETHAKASGCGNFIVWTDMPRVAADEIEKFLEVKGVENVIMSMQSRPAFQEAVAGYVRTIDTSFTK